MNELLEKLITLIRWSFDSKQDKNIIPQSVFIPVETSMTIEDVHMGRTLAVSSSVTVTLPADSPELTFPIGSTFAICRKSASGSATLKGASGVSMVGGNLTTTTSGGSVTIEAYHHYHVMKIAADAWMVY